MNKKLRFITETAILLALLVSLQALTKGFGQLVTGTCVNAILAVSVLVGGLGSGLTVALVSPVLAFLLGIAPQILTVPAIMVGNTVYVLLLALIYDKTGAKTLMREMISKADEVSAAIDAAMINTKVDYEPVFDVNETFDDVMTDFLAKVLKVED